MYGLFQDGVHLATYYTLQACQNAAIGYQYCVYIGN